MRLSAFRSLIFPLLFLPAFLRGQSACLVIVEEVKTPPMFGFPAKTRKVTTWLKNGDLRRDEGERSRTLLALSSGEAWLLNHRDSTIVPLSEAALQGLSMLGVGLFGLPVDAVTGRPSVPGNLFRKTGRTQLIAGRPAAEVEVRIPAQAGSAVPPQAPVLWIGTDGTPRMAEYLAVLRRLLGKAAADYEPLFEQLQELKGYPLRIRASVLGQEMTQTLLSADSLLTEASVFRLPDGYRRGSSKAIP